MITIVGGGTTLQRRHPIGSIIQWIDNMQNNQMELGMIRISGKDSHSCCFTVRADKPNIRKIIEIIGMIGGGGYYWLHKEEGGCFVQCAVYLRSMLCRSSISDDPLVAPPLFCFSSGKDGSSLFHLPFDSMHCLGVSALRFIIMKYDRLATFALLLFLSFFLSFSRHIT